MKGVLAKKLREWGCNGGIPAYELPVKSGETEECAKVIWGARHDPFDDALNLRLPRSHATAGDAVPQVVKLSLANEAF